MAFLSSLSLFHWIDAKENNGIALGEGRTTIKEDMPLSHPWKNISHEQGSPALDIYVGNIKTIVLSN